MSLFACRIAAALILFTLAVSPPSRAADPTPEQANLLEQQVRTWLSNTLGKDVALPERPVQIGPEGDHYRLSIPFGSAPNNPSLTATARPAENGTWTYADVHLTSPAHFTLSLPVPSKAAKGGRLDSATVAYTFSAAEQEGHGVFDPNYATPSTYQSSVRDLYVESNDGKQVQKSRIGRAVGASTISPVGEGRVDIAGDTTAEHYVSDAQLPDGQAVHIDADSVHFVSQIEGLSRDHAPQVLQTLIRLVGGMMAHLPQPGATASDPPPVDKDALRALVIAMNDLASAAKIDETAEGVRVTVGAVGGTATRFHFGLNGAAPNNVLSARLDLGLDGLALPGVALGPVQGFLPQHITLTPTISGIGTQDLLHLALDRLDGKAPDPGMQALFSHGGITVGLENVAIDIGTTGFAGTGSVTMTAADKVSGLGQITAANFDALVDQIKVVPQLAQALPVLVVAKGMARITGNQLVWNITYNGGKVLVNDVDLSAMGGAGGGNKARPPNADPKHGSKK